MLEEVQVGAVVCAECRRLHNLVSDEYVIVQGRVHVPSWMGGSPDPISTKSASIGIHSDSTPVVLCFGSCIIDYFQRRLNRK